MKHRSPKIKQPAIDENLVRRYLLDELPVRERERVEAGLLTDDRYYESLTALEDEVEDDLIDQYLDGELTEPERKKFERFFLNEPERAHKLKVIKDLKDHAAVAERSDAPAKQIAETFPRPYQWIPGLAIFQNPLYGFSFAVALVLVLPCCVWLWMRSNSLADQLRQAQSQRPTDSALSEQLEHASRRNEELTATLRGSEEQRARLEQDLASLKSPEPQPGPSPDKTSPPDRPSFAATLVLSSNQRSGGNLPRLTIRRGNTHARLVLNVERIDPKDYKSFRAVVKQYGGSEVWQDQDVKLQPRGNNARATLTIPADKLPEGQYVGELDGVNFDDQTERIGLYVFRVTHK